MFGILFDTKLTMEQQVEALTNRCRWKLKTLLRAQRYFNEEQMVQQYKTHILPYLEFATPAVYHATATTLAKNEQAANLFPQANRVDASGSTYKVRFSPSEYQARHSVARSSTQNCVRGRSSTVCSLVLSCRACKAHVQHPKTGGKGKARQATTRLLGRKPKRTTATLCLRTTKSVQRSDT